MAIIYKIMKKNFKVKTYFLSTINILLGDQNVRKSFAFKKTINW